jgi:hypothetical protein
MLKTNCWIAWKFLTGNGPNPSAQASAGWKVSEMRNAERTTKLLIDAPTTIIGLSQYPLL